MNKKRIPANIPTSVLTALVQSGQKGLIRFSSSLDLQIKFQRKDVTLSEKLPTGVIMATLGFIGELHGTISLIMDEVSFRAYFAAMTCGMLEPDLQNPVVGSSIGEMLNMISGGMATKLAEQDYAVDITPPQLFWGNSISQVETRTERNFILPYRIVGKGGLFYLTILAARYEK